MSGFTGISRINGVTTAALSRLNGRTQPQIFQISNAPLESNLFRLLTPNAWGSFSSDTNYASFVAIASGSSKAQAFFQYDNHITGNTYNFTCNKTGTTGGRNFEFAVATDSTLNNIADGGIVDVGASSGSISGSVTASSTNTTIYIGFRMMSTTSTDTYTIDNFRVTIS